MGPAPPGLGKYTRCRQFVWGWAPTLQGQSCCWSCLGKSPTTIAQVGRWRVGGLGAWRCNLGDISSSAAGEFAAKKGFLDALKPSLLKALPNLAIGGGACLEILGANAGLPN